MNNGNPLLHGRRVAGCLYLLLLSALIEVNAFALNYTFHLVNNSGEYVQVYVFDCNGVYQNDSFSLGPNRSYDKIIPGNSPGVSRKFRYNWGANCQVFGNCLNATDAMPVQSETINPDSSCNLGTAQPNWRIKRCIKNGDSVAHDYQMSINGVVTYSFALPPGATYCVDFSDPSKKTIVIEAITKIYNQDGTLFRTDSRTVENITTGDPDWYREGQTPPATRTDTDSGTNPPADTASKDGGPIDFGTTGSDLAKESTLKTGIQALYSVIGDGLDGINQLLRANGNRLSSIENDISSGFINVNGNLINVKSAVDAVKTEAQTANTKLASIDTSMSSANTKLDSLVTKATTANNYLTTIDATLGQIRDKENLNNTALNSIDTTAQSMNSRLNEVKTTLASMDARDALTRSDIQSISSQVNTHLNKLTAIDAKLVTENTLSQSELTELQNQGLALNTIRDGINLIYPDTALIKLRMQDLKDLQTIANEKLAEGNTTAANTKNSIDAAKYSVDQIKGAIDTSNVKLEAIKAAVESVRDAVNSQTQPRERDYTGVLNQIEQNTRPPATTEADAGKANRLYASGEQAAQAGKGMMDGVKNDLASSLANAGELGPGDASRWVIGFAGVTVDLNPMHLQGIPDLAEWVRRAITWIATVLLAFYICRVTFDAVRSAGGFHAATAASAVPVVSSATAEVMAASIAVAVLLIPAAFVAFFSTNGNVIPALSNKPLFSSSTAIAEGINLLNQFVPLVLCVGYVTAALIYRVSVTSILFVVQIIVRFLVG